MTKYFMLSICILLTCCIQDRNTLDKDSKIKLLGLPIKIEYYKHIQGQAFKTLDTAEFTISDNLEIEKTMNEIRMADNPEPCKGAGWDRIILTYTDTILKINTNKKKIGFGASGMFYDLNRNNFITNRIAD